jgi:cytochrome P450
VDPQARVVTLPPGPSWPRALQTAAWFVRPVSFLNRAHERYGDMFTIEIGAEPTWVVLADPAAVKEVFAGDPEVFRAGEGNAILGPILGTKSVLLLDGAQHMRARKLLLPPFHGDRLKAFATVMREVADREVASWRTGDELTLIDRMQDLTLEIIMRTIFGSADERLRETTGRMLDNTSSIFGMILVALLGPERLSRQRIFRREMDPVDTVLFDVIAERAAEGDIGERDDVLSMLLEAGMEDQELRDELMTLLVAGHETTATALAWAVERLVRHPEAWDGLRSGDEAWADAIVKETLRLRPVLPLVVRRLARDVEIAGVPLPAGVAVTPSIWLIHRRPDIFPDPHAFKPERWLDMRPTTSTWLPFGGGVRRCIGAAFAEMEMRIALQAIAQGADLRALVPEPERVRRRAISFAPSRGGAVRVAGVRAPRAASSNGAPPRAHAAAPGPTG